MAKQAVDLSSLSRDELERRVRDQSVQIRNWRRVALAGWASFAVGGAAAIAAAVAIENELSRGADTPGVQLADGPGTATAGASQRRRSSAVSATDVRLPTDVSPVGDATLIAGSSPTRASTLQRPRVGQPVCGSSLRR